MKKIPTLFKRDHEWMATPEVTPGFEWVLLGEGAATVKYDGSCTMIKDGKFYKRYDAKKGKKPPEGAIPCQEKPDPVTGHWPHWVEVGDGPEDKWFRRLGMEKRKTGHMKRWGRIFRGTRTDWNEMC